MICIRVRFAEAEIAGQRRNMEENRFQERKDMILSLMNEKEYVPMKLKELAEASGAQAEYQALCKEAELGRRYRKDLEDGVVRLGLALELGVSEPVLRSLAKTAGADDLMALKEALQCRLDESLPVVTQLGGFGGKGEELESGFLI